MLDVDSGGGGRPPRSGSFLQIRASEGWSVGLRPKKGSQCLGEASSFYYY